MGCFRMRIETIDDQTSAISYSKMVNIRVSVWVADFYRSDPVWPTLRKIGPLKQAQAIYWAYKYITEQLGYDGDVAFKDLSDTHRRRAKKLITEIIARGMQTGLIKYGKPTHVQQSDPTNARDVARKIVENRVIVDKTINGTYL